VRRLALAALAVAAMPCAMAVAASPQVAEQSAASTTTPTTTTPQGTACGASTLNTISAVVAGVANNIYRGELGGGEVAVDQRRVTQSVALLTAVAAGNRAAARRAVHAIVYHSLWHVVRLRVLDTGGHIVAEIGGPYVLAPVTGTLRLGGRVIGSYMMSVQDDYGFTILEVHAAGLPAAMYYGGRNVADTGGPLAGRPLPATLPTGPTLTLAGKSYDVLEETYGAFPTGTVTAVILIPPPSASLAAQSCGAVRALEVGHVAQLLAARFVPLDLSYAKYAAVVHDDTGALVILRIGPRALPGSEALGPAIIPASGPVSYLGRSYWVVSFAPTPPARIYVLVGVPSTPGPTT
jgi:hypothetical protein